MTGYNEWPNRYWEPGAEELELSELEPEEMFDDEAGWEAWLEDDELPFH